jgi:hypothetical protein
VLERLYECVFVFIKHHVHTTFFSNSVHTTTSSLEVSSQGLPSPMHKHDEPSERFPVVDLSSEEEEAAMDTSRDEEISRKLFGDLNHGLLGPPGDGSVIVINDSEEEEEVCKDDRTDAGVTPFCPRNSLAPSASAAANIDAPVEVQDDSSDGEDGADTS